MKFGIRRPTPAIAANYDAENFAERMKNKSVLQEKFGLAENKDAFILAIVSRLTKQKGLDLLPNVYGHDTLRELPIQLVIVGDGESDLMGYFQELAEKHKGRVAAHLQFDPVLPHVVFAGADSFLCRLD